MSRSHHTLLLAATSSLSQDTRQAYEEALRRREMYNFMAARLKSQTMVLDKEAKGLQELLAVTRQDKEQACLNLHAGKQERAAAEAMVAKLQRKLEKGRSARADKLERFDTTIEEQVRCRADAVRITMPCAWQVVEGAVGSLPALVPPAPFPTYAPVSGHGFRRRSGRQWRCGRLAAWRSLS